MVDHFVQEILSQTDLLYQHLISRVLSSQNLLFCEWPGRSLWTMDSWKTIAWELLPWTVVWFYFKCTKMWWCFFFRFHPLKCSQSAEMCQNIWCINALHLWRFWHGNFFFFLSKFDRPCREGGHWKLRTLESSWNRR